MHRAMSTLAPPSHDRHRHFTVVPWSAYACGVRPIIAATIQCP